MSLWMRKRKAANAPSRTIRWSHTVPMWVTCPYQMATVDRGQCSLKEGRKEIAIRTGASRRVDQRKAIMDAVAFTKVSSPPKSHKIT